MMVKSGEEIASNLSKEEIDGVMKIREVCFLMAKKLMGNPVMMAKAAIGFVEGGKQVAFKRHKELNGIKCRKGCANCCEQMIRVSKFEAKNMANEVRSGRVSVDMDLLKDQAKSKGVREYDQDEWIKRPSEKRRCVFLQKDNSCGIYENRPIVCRTYYSLSDPVFCKVDATGPEPVLIPMPLEMVGPVTFFQEVDEVGVLAKMLYEELK